MKQDSKSLVFFLSFILFFTSGCALNNLTKKQTTRQVVIKVYPDKGINAKLSVDFVLTKSSEAYKNINSKQDWFGSLKRNNLRQMSLVENSIADKNVLLFKDGEIIHRTYTSDDVVEIIQILAPMHYTHLYVFTEYFYCTNKENCFKAPVPLNENTVDYNLLLQKDNFFLSSNQIVDKDPQEKTQPILFYGM